MIVFDLECRPHGHRFEGWFGSSEDFVRQQERGLLTCPQCASPDVAKALMAPRLTRKGNQRSEAKPVPAPVAPAPQAMMPPPVEAALPPEMREKLHAALSMVAAAQAEALKSSRWVGKDFAEDARAMHYGDIEPEAIHGQTTPEEAKALIEEGVEIAPVLFPIAPPDKIN